MGSWRATTPPPPRRPSRRRPGRRKEAKDRETAAAAETARLAEVERLHAAELETERANARARGAASFHILGTARERQVEAKPQPMTHTLEAGLARGQELFGSEAREQLTPVQPTHPT